MCVIFFGLVEEISKTKKDEETNAANKSVSLLSQRQPLCNTQMNSIFDVSLAKRCTRTVHVQWALFFFSEKKFREGNIFGEEKL